MGIVLGIIGGLILIRWLYLAVKCNSLEHEKKDLILKYKALPHTMRNKIENYRIQTKDLKKMTDELCDEINNLSDFIGEDGNGVWK